MEQITQSQKSQIKQAVIDKIKLSASQAEAARQLSLSDAHIINIRKGDFTKVSDKLMRELSSKLGIQLNGGWRISENTKAFVFVTNMLDDSQKRGLRQILIGPWGSGKSESLRSYAKKHRNVFYMECENFYTKKVFLSELKKALGLPDMGEKMADSSWRIIDFLNKKVKPLLIIDEAGELEDAAFKLIKAYSNKTKAAIIVAGTLSLQNKIEKRLKKQKETYGEFFDRFGARFLMMPQVDENSILEVCKENGINDQQRIDYMVNQGRNKSYRLLKRLIATQEYIEKNI